MSPDPAPPFPSAGAADVTRAYRRRGWAITAIFFAVELVIVLLGATGIEGINVLRSFAVGESHWSKAEKTAIITLHRLAATRATADYRDFEQAIAMVEGDRAARLALQDQIDWTRAADGFARGGNDAVDVPGLVAGFVLFHDWPPFAQAVGDWARGDAWMATLKALGRSLHDRVRHGAAPAQLGAMLHQARLLDIALSRNESAFAHHMGEASREAMTTTLILFALLSAAACAGGILMAWHILYRGLRAERDAIASQTRVVDFAELATDWFGELDRDFVVTYVSKHLSSAAPNILVGQRWTPGSGFTGFTRPDTALMEAVANRLPFRDMPVRENEPGGKANHWSVSGKPQFAADGSFAGYRISARNITRIVETLEQLARARDEAERANRAKSSFLANMSHELRTPLNAILGFSELIGMQVQAGKGEARHGSYAHDIQTSGRHLLAIINDLLEHSRIEAGEMSLHVEPFDGAEALEGVRTLCQPRADALGVTLRIAVPRGLPPVQGDALRFKQVLINIVTNAIKFSPEGEVTVSAQRDGAMLAVEVLDNGIGMDAAGIEQAMKAFGQVDSGLNRRYEGTGLGVPLARALTELQGGRFAIASKPGAGTRVTITMLLAADILHEIAVAAA